MNERPESGRRFVVLLHSLPSGDARQTHWDLMLELDGRLRTWELPAAPRPGEPQNVLALPDHRLSYLDYEGPISNNRGSVVRWDQGVFDLIEERPAQLMVELHGQRLAGRVRLSQSGASPQSWRLEWAAPGAERPSA